MPTGPPDSRAGASGAARLSEQLRRRVLPATVAIGILISVGFPAVYVALELQSLRRNAAVYAQHIASRIEDFVVETPGLWQYQTYKYAEILHGFPKSEPIRRIAVVDDAGRRLAGYEPAGSGTAIWDRHGASAAAPIRFRGEAVGAVEVGMSYGPLVAVSAVMFGVSTALGIGLAFLVYRHPAAIVRSLEGRIYDLIEETGRANRELTRVLGETRRQRAEATALEEVARDLTSSLQWDRVLQRIVDRARDVCDGDLAFFAPYDTDRACATIAAIAGARTAMLASLVIRPGQGAAGKVLETGQPFETRDYHADARLSREYASIAEAEGIVSLVVVPVEFDDVITGLLWVARRTSRPFGDPELGMLTRLADQAAIAQKNARLYQDAERALRELRVAQEQLVRGETLRAVGELAGGMAHHLNNVLAVILGRVQLLLARTEDPAVRRGLTIVETAAVEGAEVVGRVQRFTRAEPRGTEIEIDVNELLREIVDLTRSRWHDEPAVHGIRVDVGIQAGEMPPITGMPSALREVFLNIVTNAIEAVPQGGAVTIKTWAAGEDVWVSVTDTGVGMSDDVRRRAFEPFFTTKGPQSTGLGLSVAYGTVQRHGGELTIESVPSRGTTVSVRLPRRGRSVASGGAPRQAARPLRILVVDDEAGVLALTEELLRSMGHEPLAARGGRAALAMLEARSDVDLVLTDLGMPEMSGWDMTRLIKARWPALPIAMMTGWGETPPGAEADGGLVAFVIPKPMVADQLAHWIGVATPPAERA